MSTAVYPLPLNEELAREVAQAAEATGLSRAELMRQALAFGVPQVVAALQRPARRLTTVDALPTRQSRALYRLPEDDRDQVLRLMKAQEFQSTE